MPSRSLAPLATPPAVGGEFVHPEELASLAGEVAARQRTRNTRRTYAACYRQFVALLVVRLGRPPRRGDLTALTVRAYRDQLEADGRTAATIAHHLSALRRLAAELDADPAIQRVRADRVAPREPRALVAGEYAALLAVPDRRSRAGVRDLAVLYLLGDAGLRRSELVALTYDDVAPVRRHHDRRLRPAVAARPVDQTDWVVRVRQAKRGKARTIPLSRPALAALLDWRDVRPACPTDRIFVSLPRGQVPPAPLSPAAVGEIVAKHARRARLPADRHTAHVLRHTFCTLLAERGVALEVIAELAGHADVRTTRAYVTVAERRCHDAIHHTFDVGRTGLARARP